MKAWVFVTDICAYVISAKILSSSQKAGKVTHIKRTLLDQAMILFNRTPFQNGNFSLRKEFAPRGSKFFSLRAVPYGMINHLYHIGWSPLNVTIFITHMCNCVMGAMSMLCAGSRKKFLGLLCKKINPCCYSIIRAMFYEKYCIQHNKTTCSYKTHSVVYGMFTYIYIFEAIL